MRQFGRCGSIALATALLITGLATSAARAQAPPGPFPCETSTIFVSQGSPATQLNALTYGSGSSVFVPIGPPQQPAYNAIAYREADGFIYGIDTRGALLRINEAGHVEMVGFTNLQNINVGSFDDADRYYVMQGASSVLYEVDLTTAAVSPIFLQDRVRAADLTWIDGRLWGQVPDSPQLVRVDPATGAVDTFFMPDVANLAAGAAWTYGNGNLGLSDNHTGTILQIAIDDPNGPSPAFTVVSAQQGPASGWNDGTACESPPADLAIAKSGPEQAMVGEDVSWTVTVRNDGPGGSSGSVVDDTVPGQFTNVASPTPGCTVAGNAVSCNVGPLAEGEQTAIEITATASQPGTAVNTATVTGNEEDPEPDNNSATTTTRIVTLVGLCRGTPIAALGLFPATANGRETPCTTEERSLVRVNHGNVLTLVQLRATGVAGKTLAGERSAAASAYVADATLKLPGVSLSARAVHSEASSEVGDSCDDTSVAGQSRLGTLVVNGRSYAVGDRPATIPLGIGAVHVNQRVVQGSTITQRALFVDLPGTALDVRLGEARAGMACST